MALTYEPISTNTLGSNTATVTFSSIPQTYTDLVLIVNGVQSANQYVAIRFNGDTAGNYSQTRLYGSGAAGVSDRQSSVTFGRLSVGDPTNRFAVVASVFDYTNATTYKTWLSRSNITGDYVSALVGVWRISPVAITSLSVLTTTVDTFLTGTTFTLYGIKAA